MKTFGLLIVFTFILLGCSANPVDIVKELTLDLDKSVTIGNALDNYKYFYYKRWSSKNDEQHRTIIEFIGTINMIRMFQDSELVTDSIRSFIDETFIDPKEVASVHVLFLLDADKKGCKLVYEGLIVKGVDSSCKGIVATLYRNTYGRIYNTIISEVLKKMIEKQVDKYIVKCGDFYYTKSGAYTQYTYKQYKEMSISIEDETSGDFQWRGEAKISLPLEYKHFDRYSNAWLPGAVAKRDQISVSLQKQKGGQWELGPINFDAWGLNLLTCSDVPQ